MAKKHKNPTIQERWAQDDDFGLSGEAAPTFEDAYNTFGRKRPQQDSDADDATTRIGKTRGTMAKERGQTMQKMAGARVANVTAAAGSTGFEKNTTLKGHKTATARAFKTAKTVK
jgi:hypothetical protein